MRGKAVKSSIPRSQTPSPTPLKYACHLSSDLPLLSLGEAAIGSTSPATPFPPPTNGWSGGVRLLNVLLGGELLLYRTERRSLGTRKPAFVAAAVRRWIGGYEGRSSLPKMLNGYRFSGGRIVLKKTFAEGSFRMSKDIGSPGGSKKSVWLKIFRNVTAFSTNGIVRRTNFLTWSLGCGG